MKPRNNLVLVRLHSKKERKEGQIIVPTTGNEDFDAATVVKVGRGHLQSDGTYKGTEDLQPGQVVVVKARQSLPGPAGGRVKAGTTLPFKIDGETLNLVNEQDIVAIIEREKDASV